MAQIQESVFWICLPAGRQGYWYLQFIWSLPACRRQGIWEFGFQC